MKRNSPKVDLSVDPFLERGRAAAAWLGKRTYFLRLGALIVLLVGVSLAWFANTRANRLNDASEHFGKGLAALTEAVQESTQKEVASSETSATTVQAEEVSAQSKEADASEKAKRSRQSSRALLERAREAFEAASVSGGQRGVGSLAAVLLADTEVRLGHPEKAVEPLRALLTGLPSTDPVYFLAAQRLAAIEEAKGDVAAAAKVLAPFATDRARPFSDWATWSLARLDVIGKDEASAKDRLDKLESDFSQTSRAEDIARLRARIARVPNEKSGL